MVGSSPVLGRRVDVGQQPLVIAERRLAHGRSTADTHIGEKGHHPSCRRSPRAAIAGAAGTRVGGAQRMIAALGARHDGIRLGREAPGDAEERVP